MTVAPYQGAFAMVAPLRDEQAAAAVRALLDEAGRDVRFNRIMPLDKLTRVHYLRMLVVEGEPDGHGDPVPPSLALATDYDPPLDDHLDELVRVGGDGLAHVLEHCAGFPRGDRSPDAVRAFIEAHARPCQARYTGTPFRTARQIRDEAELRRTIAAFVDAGQRQGAWTGSSPVVIRRAIRKHLRRDPAMDWVWQRTPEAPDTTLGLATRILGMVALVVTCFWWLLPLYGLLRWQERRDARRDDPDGSLARAEARRRMERMVAREDFLVQNQLTHLVAIKPGWLRLLALHIVLWVIDALARFYYVRGHLGGIASIHFARWMIIDGGKRLIFFSNYDGSWESYLGDFVDRASSPLSAIWSNGVGFPPTRFLVGQGARDEDRFKTWARSKQIRTQLWYCAYPELSVRNINDNSAIRAGLIDEVDDDEVAAWVGRL